MLTLFQTPKFFGMCELGINIDCRDEIFCCEMSPSGKMIAVGTNKGITRIFNVEHGKFILRISYFPDYSKILKGQT